MQYQDRVNRPLGMTDLDLLIYDKDIYTMYRTHEGLETDAFRYDPVVSAGMLASDYAFAQGMQWVNLLTPASQDKVNPGDGLIVPVQTYDNYKNLPPIEKYLTHEVSYTANEMNIVRDESLHNEFVGDFNNYFDKESGFTREATTMPVENPIPVRPPTGSLFNPIKPPIRPTLFETAPPKPIKKPNFNDVSGNINQVKAKLAACIKYYSKPVLVKPKVGAVERRLIMPSSIDPCKKLRDRLKYLLAQQTAQTSTSPVAPASAPIQQAQNLIAASTPSATLTVSSGGEIISGGYIGGGGGVSSVGYESETQPESQPEAQPEVQAPAVETAKATIVEKKMDYIPVIVGAIICAVIGYFYASKSKKNIKIFSFGGAVVGGVIGYLYSTKKGSSKSESGYFVDDFYR